MSGVPVRAFSGGIVREGAPDVEVGSEMEACDEFDIGPRGGLVLASAPVSWGGTLEAWSAILDVIAGREDQLVGNLFFAGIDHTGKYALAIADQNQPVHSALPIANILYSLAAAVIGAGTQVQILSVPYSVDEVYLGKAYKSQAIILVNFGAREGSPNAVGIGLHRVGVNSVAGVPEFGLVSLGQYDALGTGVQSEEFPGGTHAQLLQFRGIFKYGPLICGFGQGALAGTPGHQANGDNRLMFSNIARPLKWGRDDQSGGAGDRAYRDIDAVTIGAAGEIIRAGLEWRGRGWIGTNRELHWFAGYGVDSLVTDGTRSQFRQNVLGPHCLLEGPDTQLHGVGSQGHWVFDGNEFDLAGRRLIKFDGTSLGLWDLIWTDASRADGFPGKTNQDLVWMLRDDVAQQVWIVIPFCDATAGYGPGADTVVIKYHCRGGGYTRQVFLGKTFTAGCAIPREANTPETRILAPIGDSWQLARYGFKASAIDVPVPPLGAPVFAVTRLPAGPEGEAIVSWLNLTLGWLVTGFALRVALAVDGNEAESSLVTIADVAPVAPAVGDVWLDTSGALYALSTWAGTRWFPLVGGGQAAPRATIPIPFSGIPGTRFTATVTQATLAAGNRYQIEALTFDAQPGSRSTRP